MRNCEDWPCCGHESGCCPATDDDGTQTDIKCICGASVPLNSRSSLCSGCLRSAKYGDYGSAGWPGSGDGSDDLADYNANEQDDYRDE